MPSTPEPLRSRDERLADVYRRADRHRRRRHAVVAGAVAAVLLPALAVAALQGGDDGSTTLVADAPEVSTTDPTTATTSTAPPDEIPLADPPAAPAEEGAAPEAPAPTTTTSWPVTGPGPAPTTTAPSDHGAALRNRSFRSTSVTRDGQPRPLVDGTTIDVQFADEGRGDLIRWRSGCNTAGGPLVITADRLDVEDGGSTAMGCDADRMAQEEWVHAFFLSDPSWAADGSRLTLTSDGTVIELEEISYDDFWP